MVYLIALAIWYITGFLTLIHHMRKEKPVRVMDLLGIFLFSLLGFILFIPTIYNEYKFKVVFDKYE